MSLYFFYNFAIFLTVCDPCHRTVHENLVDVCPKEFPPNLRIGCGQIMKHNPHNQRALEAKCVVCGT